MGQIGKKGTFTALLTFILLASLGGMPSNAQGEEVSKKYARLLAKADRLLDEGYLPRAARVYARANQEAGGSSPEALIGLGTARYKTQEYADSEAAARQVLDLTGIQNHQMTAAYNLLGLSILQSGTDDERRLMEAEQAFRHVLEFDRAAHDARLHLALVLLELGDNSEALTLARQAVSEAEDTNQSDEARILVCRSRLGGTRDVSDELKERIIDDVAAQSVIGETSEKEESNAKFMGSVDGTLVKPVPIFRPQPQYPKELRKRELEGKVAVQVIVDQEGCFASVKVFTSPHIEFEKAATRALRTWTYRPATLDEKSVAVFYNLTINFGLKQQD